MKKKLVGIIIVILVLLVVAGAANQKTGQKPARTNNNQQTTTQTPSRSGGELDDVLNALEGSFETDTIDDKALIDAVEDESVESVGKYEI